MIYVAVEQGGLFPQLTLTPARPGVKLTDSYYRADDRWYRDIHRLVIAGDRSRSSSS